MSSSLISDELAATVLSAMALARYSDTVVPFFLVNAHDMPRFRYNADQKNFFLDRSPIQSFGSAEDRVALARERHLAVRQRVLRHVLFAPPVLSHISQAASADHHNLTPVESLLGSSGVRIVLAALGRRPNGDLCLEDPSGVVRIDLSACTIDTGFYTLHCMVLAEGEMRDGVFCLVFLGMPAAEPQAASLHVFGHAIDFFGAAPAAQDAERVLALEQSSKAMLVALADVTLTDATVIGMLRELFSGFAEATPIAFVLCGNFLASAAGDAVERYEQLAACFATLADLIAEQPVLAREAHFILVPGPTDPGLADVLPRKPFAEPLRAPFARIRHVHFASSPCRVRLYTQVICIMRENLVSKLRRNCLFAPSTQLGVPHEHAVKTVCDQASLMPLPLSHQPSYWSAQHALNLYPLPDLLILADTYSPYESTCQAMPCVNPSSFHTGYGFVSYSVADRQVQFLRVRSSAGAASQRAMPHGDSQAMEL